MARPTTPRAGDAETIAGVRVTHPDKPLWPDVGLTKRHLAQYYLAVAAPLLAWIGDRPISVLRMPEGLGGPRFFQRHPMPGASPGIRRVAIPGEEKPFIQVDSAAGLVSLAQQAVMELHPWGAPGADLEHPDRLVLDLDPDEALPFAQVVAAAQAIRGRMVAAGLVPFCRTTGGKGLHVVAPLAPRTSWAAAKAFARSLCEAEAAAAPERYTIRAAKAERHGRIFLDYLRNDLFASAIANWSPRARAGAPFAAPLAWEEVEPGLEPHRFTLATVSARLKAPDAWASFARSARPLPPH